MEGKSSEGRKKTKRWGTGGREGGRKEGRRIESVRGRRRKQKAMEKVRDEGGMEERKRESQQ